MDVESLYTTKEHKEGLAAPQYCLNDRQEMDCPPAQCISSLTEWTLSNNIFVFQDGLFRQVKGCGMGACYSPSYAVLWVNGKKDYVFASYKHWFLNKIMYWGSYIDDAILLWTGSEEELLSFHQ